MISKVTITRWISLFNVQSANQLRHSPWPNGGQKLVTLKTFFANMKNLLYLIHFLGNSGAITLAFMRTCSKATQLIQLLKPLFLKNRECLIDKKGPKQLSTVKSIEPFVLPESHKSHRSLLQSPQQ